MAEVHILDKSLQEVLDQAEAKDKEDVNKCYRWCADEEEYERIECVWEEFETARINADPQMDTADFLLCGLLAVELYTKEMNDKSKLAVLKVIATKINMNLAIITSGENNG